MGRMSEIAALMGEAIVEQEIGERLAAAEVLGRRLTATRIMPLAQEAIVSPPDRQTELLAQIVGLCRMELATPAQEAYYAADRRAN